MFTKQIMSTTAHLGRTRFIPSTSLQSIVLPQVEGFPGLPEEAASHTHTGLWPAHNWLLVSQVGVASLEGMCGVVITFNRKMFNAMMHWDSGIP